jgi:hypothetical protein
MSVIFYLIDTDIFFDFARDITHISNKFYTLGKVYNNC